MKCKQVKKYLYLYAGNDLAGRKISKIEKHLGVCEACSEELERIKQYIGITADSLKADQVEPDQQVLWQQIQGEIESRPKNKTSEKKIPDLFFNKYPFFQPYKTVLGLAVSCLLLLLVFSPFTIDNTDKEHSEINNQKTVSELDEYPVVEAFENKNATVMTMQTDDPKIKVVWFFDEEFKI